MQVGKNIANKQKGKKEEREREGQGREKVNQGLETIGESTSFHQIDHQTFTKHMFLAFLLIADVKVNQK